MKTGKSGKYSVGWIALDLVLLAGVIIDIRSGQLTLNKWYTILVVSAILGILLVKIYKKRIKKEKEQFKSTKAESRKNVSSTGE